MPLALIYARSRNYCIGRDGVLPWNLPDEYAHFERTTAGGVVIMGRRSFQDHQCVLPGRTNIVITRNAGLPLSPGMLRATSLPGALALAREAQGPIFVIGGTRVFREALPLASVVYETVIDADIAGDTFVDPFDFQDWHTDILRQHPGDALNAFGFTIYRHVRADGKGNPAAGQ